jgi:hypothetical protein
MAAKKSGKRHHFDPEYSAWHKKFPEFAGIETCLKIFDSRDEFPGSWQDVCWMEMTNNAEANLDEYISVAKREVQNGGAFAFTILWTLHSVRSPKCESLFESLVDHPLKKVCSIAQRGLQGYRKPSTDSRQRRTKG